MTPARRGTWSSTGRWCRRPRCTMHTCRRWRSHTRRSPRRTSTSPHRQPEPDGLPSRRRHDLMKPLHLIALLAALMGPGCTTALPVRVTEIGKASCRERVLKYDYISVVAVSLQKTTQKKNKKE